MEVSDTRSKKGKKRKAEKDSVQIEAIMDTSITATNNIGMINTPVSALQFETLSHKLDNITETINIIYAKIDLVKGDVTELKHSVEFNSAEIKQVFDEIKVFAKNMQMVKNEMENLKMQINTEKKQNNTLQGKVIYMESQPRWDNLLINGNFQVRK